MSNEEFEKKSGVSKEDAIQINIEAAQEHSDGSQAGCIRHLEEMIEHAKLDIQSMEWTIERLKKHYRTNREVTASGKQSYKLTQISYAHA